MHISYIAKLLILTSGGHVFFWYSGQLTSAQEFWENNLIFFINNHEKPVIWYAYDIGWEKLIFTTGGQISEALEVKHEVGGLPL